MINLKEACEGLTNREIKQRVERTTNILIEGCRCGRGTFRYLWFGKLYPYRCKCNRPFCGN